MTVWAKNILEKSHLRYVCLAITATKGSNPILDIGNRTKLKNARMNTWAEVFPISLGSFEKLATKKNNGNLHMFDLFSFLILEILSLRNSARRLTKLSPTSGSTTLGLKLIPMVT